MKFKIILAVLFAVLLSAALGAQEASVDLDEAVNIAVGNSPLLESSRLGVELAKFELNKVKKATNPTVSASAVAAVLGPSKKDSDGERITPNQQGSVSGTVNWPLDITGAYKKGTKAQTAAYEAEKYNFEASLSALIYNVKTAYFNCLSAEDQLNNAKSTLEVSKASLANVMSEVEAGNKPKFDQTRQELDVVTRESAVITAQNTYAQALNTFNNVLGVTGSAVYIPKHSDSYLSASLEGIDAEKDNLIDIALNNRAELKSLERMIDGRKLYIDIVKAQYGPSFSLSGSVTPQLLQRDINGKYSWNAGLNVSMPIFTGGIAKEEINSAKTTLTQTETNYLAQAQSVSTEVMNAILSENTAKQQIASAEKSVQLATEALDIANLRYKEQLGTYLDVQSALDSKYQAENTLIDAKYSHVLSIYNLEKVLGHQREMSKLMQLVWEGTGND